jgi:hypothetical protein
VPQASQLALQGCDPAGVSGALTPFTQFPLDTFEFLAQPVQPLPELLAGSTLLPLVIVVGPAAACVLGLITDST